MFGLVLHGGAGPIIPSNSSAQIESSYRAKITEALTKGYDILAGGGSSMDAVEETVVVLEDSPLFNAGKGSSFTSSGANEMDASVMVGGTLEAGAVGGVTHIKNPIRLARMVMEKSPHVLIAGQGAEEFGRPLGIEEVSQDYFFTENKWEQMQRAKAAVAAQSSENAPSPNRENKPGSDQGSFGTVGAVALDTEGNLAAATSTGGLNNKQPGRIGDSPIIGAGTYANNQTCAVSCTGQGEYFMRTLVAYDISALMAYAGKSLQEAVDIVVTKKFTQLGGSGGLIAIDPEGNMVMPFNTERMYRGQVGADGEMTVKLYRE